MYPREPFEPFLAPELKNPLYEGGYEVVWLAWKLAKAKYMHRFTISRSVRYFIGGQVLLCMHTLQF